jgi:hypothetical protein
MNKKIINIQCSMFNVQVKTHILLNKLKIILLLILPGKILKQVKNNFTLSIEC